MLQPVRRRTWGPRGQTPLQKAWQRHDRLSVISALTLAPYYRRLGLYFSMHTENIHTEEALEFITSLHRHLRRRFILVLDRWSVHRAAVRRLLAQGAPWLEVEWLPAYAPELNPVEYVWGHTKYGDLANYLPDDLLELELKVGLSMKHTRHRPDLLRSFYHAANLTI